jgi:hypothetical protein
MDEEKLESRIKGLEQHHKLMMILILISLSSSLIALAITFAVLFFAD